MNKKDNKLFAKTEYALYNYTEIDIKLKSIELDIDMLRNDITLKAISYEEKTGPTNAFSSSVENEVIRREEVIQEQISKLKKDKLLYTTRKMKIENSLNLLTTEDLKLIKLRYFTKPKNSWVAIALELNMDRVTCMQRRNKIINKLSEYIFN